MIIWILIKCLPSIRFELQIDFRYLSIGQTYEVYCNNKQGFEILSNSHDPWGMSIMVLYAVKIHYSSSSLDVAVVAQLEDSHLMR